MFGVGRLGSYISRGMYTFSGPFHPFGGAVDIIVVELPDGSFRSSPWYVRFGKFQGVLKAAERMVIINVNGVDADFHMYLDNKGEAFFLQEVDVEEAESDPNSTDLISVAETGVKIMVPRTKSPQTRIFGFPFGRRSRKENGFQEEDTVGVERVSSLDRAEIAAELLELRWSTNLSSTKNWNAQSKESSNTNLPVSGVVGEVGVEDEPCTIDSLLNNFDDDNVACITPGCQRSSSAEEIPCSTGHGNSMEVLTVEETYVGVDPPPDRSEVSRDDNSTVDNERNAETNFSEISMFKVSSSLDIERNEGCISFVVGPSNTGTVPWGGNGSILESRSRIDKTESCVCPDTKTGLGKCNERYDSSLTLGDSKEQLPDNSFEPVFSINANGMDNKENILVNASCNGDEKTICDIPEVQVDDNIFSFPLCQTGVVPAAFNLKKKISEEVPSDEAMMSLKNSTAVETINSGLSSENLYPCASDLNSRPLVLEEERSSIDISNQPLFLHVDECSGDLTHDINANATHTENSGEVQFSFSDFDDPEAQKVEGTESLSPRGVKEYLPKISPEISEEELAEAITSIDELYHVMNKPLRVEPFSKTSSISISKVHKDADLEFLVPEVASLPNMPFLGDNLNPYDFHEPLSRSLDSNLDALKIVNDDILFSLELGAVQQQVAHVKSTTDNFPISEDIKMFVSDPATELSLCRHLLYEGMGYEPAAFAFDSKKLDMDEFFSLVPEILKDKKLVVRIGGLYFPWDAALPIASAIGSQGMEQTLEPKGMIAVGEVNSTSEGGPQKPIDSRNGSQKVWPLSFKKSNSLKDENLVSETASGSPMQKNRDRNVAGIKAAKKKIRAPAPTSEQLASLNLKEGKNAVTFTFSTAMLGNQQVDARIFLWKWNTRIVVSDVDGTITKSDVLGQFMPLMGIDWSQTGVARLFSAIKENGYHVLFLSARAISQAYLTRQFLVNLKQEGKALPEGPVVISPDGLFPSLYREVIRRAPHEFKISCLEDIRSLFPRDHNPFYAGFGNRDTDELSYLKVGIPKGKIFTINPKGEVFVNQRVDSKSYTSLHALVHDMFPPTNVIEEEGYNSWNFWRLPPADVDI